MKIKHELNFSDVIKIVKAHYDTKGEEVIWWQFVKDAFESDIDLIVEVRKSHEPA
jgi:hypothetical protein